MPLGWAGLFDRPTSRNPQLFADQIDAVAHLGDRVLDLQAGVHFQEVESALRVEELDRPRTDVASLKRQPTRRIPHLLPLIHN